MIKGNLTVGGVGVTVTSGLVNGKKISNIARLDESQEFHGNICRSSVLVTHF